MIRPLMYGQAHDLSLHVQHEVLPSHNCGLVKVTGACNVFIAILY